MRFFARLRKGRSLPGVAKLLRHHQDRKEALFWIGSSSVVTNLLNLTIPIFIMQVYDRIIPYRAYSTLIWLTAGCAVALILEWAGSIMRDAIASWFAARYAWFDEKQTISRLFDSDNGLLREEGTRRFSRALESVETLQSFYSNQLFHSLFDIPFLLLFLGAIYLIHPYLALFQLTVLIFFLPSALFFRKAYLKKSIRFNQELNRGKKRLVEVLRNIKVIKAQALEEQHLRKLEAQQARESLMRLQLNRSSSMPEHLSSFFSQLLIFGTIITGGLLMLEGELSLGLITAATLLSRRVLAPLQKSIRFSWRLSDAQVALQDLLNISQQTAPVPAEFRLPDRIEGNFRVSNLKWMEASGADEQHPGLSFEAPASSTTALVCKDKRESDRLFDLLTGAAASKSGMILLDSFILSEMEGPWVCRQIAALPAGGRLYRGTILENLTRFNPNLTVQALDAASLLGLDNFAASLPRGYETVLTERDNRTLPSGIIQRISIARSFVHRPRLVIANRCDEMMDRSTLNHFFQLLDRIGSNTTRILITSRNESIERANRVIEISGGRVISSQGGSD